MDTKQTTHISKFLSLVLRHQPQQIGITLDAAGWVDVGELLDAMAAHRTALTREELEEVVSTSEKKRFAFSDDGLRIRASQGHSVEVELGYSPATPPALLFHGTVDRFLISIRGAGLFKGQRHHVHLSDERATAEKVGQRRGRPVVLTVRAAYMFQDGLAFFKSANGVWLTDHVPVQYLDFPGSTELKAQ